MIKYPEEIKQENIERVLKLRKQRKSERREKDCDSFKGECRRAVKDRRKK